MSTSLFSFQMLMQTIMANALKLMFEYTISNAFTLAKTIAQRQSRVTSVARYQVFRTSCSAA
jgi:hypothetical protein